MKLPTEFESAAMLATMDDGAIAAFGAAHPVNGDDSNALITSLVEALVVVGMCAGVTHKNLIAGIEKTWTDRELLFSNMGEEAKN